MKHIKHVKHSSMKTHKGKQRVRYHAKIYRTVDRERGCTNDPELEHRVRSPLGRVDYDKQLVT